MKKLLLLTTIYFTCLGAAANHITGGEMFYSLISQNGNSYTYHVTLKLYRDCFSTGAQLDAAAPISIFNNATFATVWNSTIPLSNKVDQNLTSPGPCIQNPPTVCYQVGYYEFNVTLPGSPQGYTISYQRCCRITGINNLVGSSSVGATYTAQIPGTSSLTSGPANNSARFFGIDTVIVCAKNYFCYNFGAFDTDGDSLSYYFCTAYMGGSSAAPAPNPPLAPPYSSVPYNSPYFDASPLGSGVTINSKTGMMCGTAPSQGIYVVTVCVDEWRNGIRIATQRKDLQIKIGDCNVAAAQPIIFDEKGIQVDPDYSSCNGYIYKFQNLVANNPLVHSYYWEFGDGGTSTLPTPTHTYGDTGVYNIKLVINKGEECSDSATTKIKIYPGFFPGFTYSGICVSKPTQFLDTTKTVYGTVNSWSWDFGNTFTIADTSRLQNPTYTYNQVGTYKVKFIVTSSKGCREVVDKDVTIIDKPPLSVAFKDTLICRGDVVPLHANGNGVFSWTPAINITNANTADPTVSPSTTTKYFVQLDDNGCINRDSVNVRVVNFVTLQAMPDTVICATDAVQLRANTDGLKFSWTPAGTLNNSTLQNPIAQPLTTTTYQITSTVGSCNATDDVTVTLVPYPVANAGLDSTICFSTSAQLMASITGSSFSWSPSASLNNPNSLNPLATPAITTAYTLTVFDNLGCPKPGRDTVVISVLPKVNAFAGRDTAVVVGQPLQFNASGGETYLWTPSTSLNNSTINNPVGIYDGSFDSIRYSVRVQNTAGCYSIADVVVRIFKTNPTIFVPSAFTPNRDGKNDLFRPIPVGITRIEYFRVYNRWGQLIYNSTVDGDGWDGKLAGKEQGTGSYVWIVQGVDFTGKVVFAKGTMTLIR